MAKVLYLTSDLLFSSRVGSAAQQAGIDLQIVGSLAGLVEHLQAGEVQAVLVDLEHRAAVPEELVGIMHQQNPRPLLIGYGPHVHAARLESARAAGFHAVLSRGQFHQQAVQLLAGWAGARE